MQNETPKISNLLGSEISGRRLRAKFAEPARVGAGGYSDWLCLAFLFSVSIQALRLSVGYSTVHTSIYWLSLGSHSASDLIELDVGLLIAVA